jgi:hypothetical protein
MNYTGVIMFRLFKVILSAVVASMFISACSSGKISVDRDELAHQVIVSMDLNMQIRGKGLGENEIDYSKNQLIRVIKDKKVLPAKMQFKFDAGENIDDIKENGKIKIDGDVYDIEIENLNTSVQSQTNIQGRNDVRLDLNTKTKTWKEFNGEIEFSKKIEKEILNSRKVVIHLYSGDLPITYTFEKGFLSKLKKFITTVPKDYLAKI